jgi:hypothetical protein
MRSLAIEPDLRYIEGLPSSFQSSWVRPVAALAPPAPVYSIDPLHVVIHPFEVCLGILDQRWQFRKQFPCHVHTDGH